MSFSLCHVNRYMMSPSLEPSDIILGLSVKVGPDQKSPFYTYLIITKHLEVTLPLLLVPIDTSVHTSLAAMSLQSPIGHLSFITSIVINGNCSVGKS